MHEKYATIRSEKQNKTLWIGRCNGELTWTSLDHYTSA